MICTECKGNTSVLVVSFTKECNGDLIPKDQELCLDCFGVIYNKIKGFKTFKEEVL